LDSIEFETNNPNTAEKLARANKDCVDAVINNPLLESFMKDKTYEQKRSCAGMVLCLLFLGILALLTFIFIFFGHQ
jgi:hypothetical protein